MAQLTDLEIRKTIPVEGRQIELWDNKIKGFGVRVSPRGTKSFILLFRIGSRSRRLTLGRYPTLSLSDARKLAYDALHEVAHGHDPVAKKNAAKEGFKDFRFDCFVTLFTEKYAMQKNRSWTETKRILEREFVSRWGVRDIREITRSDVNDILDGIMQRGKHIMANRALAAIRRLFNWAVERGLIENAPTSGIRAPAKELSRDRVLNDEELKAVWQSSEEMGYPYGEIIRLLILTGQRLGEVIGLRWDEVDLKKSIWSLSAERNKASRAHEIPLVSEALQIIYAIPRLHEELLFPAKRHETDKPVSGFSKWKAYLDEKSEVTNWRLHDLRRTAATGMARAGVAPHVIERVLNHTSGTFGGVTGVYNRFGYLPEMRKALELWAAHVMALQAEK